MEMTPHPEIRGLVYQRDLGSGGFADVYLYHQLSPDRLVAVKVLRISGVTSGQAGRFMAEADAMAALNHPHIAQVHAAGVTNDGRPYIQMTYYPYGSLEDRLRHRPFSVPDVLRIGVQLCAAVETAHRLTPPLLHRDIKPSNVLVDEYGDPVLADFGIASRLRWGTDEDASLSPYWAPPEATSASAVVDERSDVYSLSATMWHLLAGHAPFIEPDGDNRAVAVMRRAHSQPVPALGRPDVPVVLERILDQALSVDPAQRPASAAELARQLNSVEQDIFGFGRVTPFKVPGALDSEYDAAPAAGAGYVETPDIGTRLMAAPPKVVPSPPVIEASIASVIGSQVVTPEVSTPVTSENDSVGQVEVPEAPTMLFPEAASPEQNARRKAKAPRGPGKRTRIGIGVAAITIAIVLVVTLVVMPHQQPRQPVVSAPETSAVQTATPPFPTASTESGIAVGSVLRLGSTDYIDTYTDGIIQVDDSGRASRFAVTGALGGFLFAIGGRFYFAGVDIDSDTPGDSLGLESLDQGGAPTTIPLDVSALHLKAGDTYGLEPVAIFDDGIIANLIVYVGGQDALQQVDQVIALNTDGVIRPLNTEGRAVGVYEQYIYWQPPDGHVYRMPFDRTNPQPIPGQLSASAMVYDGDISFSPLSNIDNSGRFDTIDFYAEEDVVTTIDVTTGTVVDQWSRESTSTNWSSNIIRQNGVAYWLVYNYANFGDDSPVSSQLCARFDSHTSIVWEDDSGSDLYLPGADSHWLYILQDWNSLSRLAVGASGEPTQVW